ncbi:MAG TPA: Rap1a/Tai family immunity protein, partial [Stellaceae bacterium]|nr:Rap1a/Tai family immunity protein [Stellaceae bacterium]
GVQLYNFCLKNDSQNVGNLTCTSYIRGFIDGMIMGTVADGKFCLPESGVSEEQGRLIAEKYMKDHPEKLNLEAGYVVGFAMIAAFPCAPGH